jgi:hypothetical protein
MEKFEKLVVVDLGQLSKTKLGSSVTSAIMIPDGDSQRLRVDTGVIVRELELSERPIAGSYILYDEDGSLMGISTTEYKLDKEL